MFWPSWRNGWVLLHQLGEHWVPKWTNGNTCGQRSQGGLPLVHMKHVKIQNSSQWASGISDWRCIPSSINDFFWSCWRMYDVAIDLMTYLALSKLTCATREEFQRSSKSIHAIDAWMLLQFNLSWLVSPWMLFHRHCMSDWSNIMRKPLHRQAKTWREYPGSFQHRPSGKFPPKRYDHTVVLAQQRIWVFGGSGSYLSRSLNALCSLCSVYFCVAAVLQCLCLGTL